MKSPAPRIHEDRVTGLILAGGRGSRMDNADKGLVLFRDRPLIVHALQGLAPQVDELMISANRNVGVYKGFCERVVPDETTDYAGPLAGIQAGLKQCATRWMLTIPCDVPFFPANLREALREACEQEHAGIAVTHAGGQQQSAFLLIRTDMLVSLQCYLDAGRRSVQGWIETERQQSDSVRDVSFAADAPMFVNLNTLAELEQWDDSPSDADDD